MYLKKKKKFIFNTFNFHTDRGNNGFFLSLLIQNEFFQILIRIKTVIDELKALCPICLLGVRKKLCN